MTIHTVEQFCHIDTSPFDTMSMVTNGGCNATADLILLYPQFLQMTMMVTALGCFIAFAVAVKKPREPYAFPALRSAIFAIALWVTLTLFAGTSLTLMIREHVIPAIVEFFESFAQPMTVVSIPIIALGIPLALLIVAYVGGGWGLIRGIILMGRDPGANGPPVGGENPRRQTQDQEA